MAKSQSETTGPRELASAEALVEVNWSGWNVRLNGGGWLGFVGSESQEDLKHITIDQAKAVGLLNRLLEMGFFYMAENYPSCSESLSINRNGTLHPTRTQVLDGGRITIQFRVGLKEHKVVMEKPITTAPMELVVWFRDFEKLVNTGFWGAE